jgi:hypothetical protein
MPPLQLLFSMHRVQLLVLLLLLQIRTQTHAVHSCPRSGNIAAHPLDLPPLPFSMPVCPWLNLPHPRSVARTARSSRTLAGPFRVSFRRMPPSIQVGLRDEQSIMDSCMVVATSAIDVCDGGAGGLSLGSRLASVSRLPTGLFQRCIC